MRRTQKSDDILGTQRLEAFSDSVFAIVMTLLFINLSVPEIQNQTDWKELLNTVWHLAPKFLSIFISFSFVAIFWVAHHQFFRTLQKTTRGLLWLNLVFLFLVCFVPFPAAIMSEFPNNKTSGVFFGTTVLMTSILLVILRWYAWVRHEEITDVSNKENINRSINRGIVMILIYAVGITVSFFYPIGAIVIYLLTPLTLLFPVKIEVETEDENGEEDKTEIVL
jgi:uncharacterized membrane protein